MTTPSGPDPDVGVRYEQVVAYLRRTVCALADEVRAVDGGWAVRTRQLPLVWTLNQLHITEPLTVAGVVSSSDAHQADLSYRHVVVDDEPTARRLEQALGSTWRVDRELLMVLMRSPERGVDGARVVELGDDDMLTLMRRWLIEDHGDMSADGLAQMEQYFRGEARLWNERCFGALADDGTPAAVTKLRSDGENAWVEDVYTAPEQRRRGLARMLVTHATALARSAGHDMTFLVADDADWPQHLYAEIGFRPVGKRWLFHRGEGE